MQAGLSWMWYLRKQHYMAVCYAWYSSCRPWNICTKPCNIKSLKWEEKIFCSQLLGCSQAAPSLLLASSQTAPSLLLAILVPYSKGWVE